MIYRFNYYRPQRSWGKVILSEACVKNSVHKGGRWYPSMPCRSSPGPHPGWRLKGSGLGGSPGPHPGGKLRGLAWGVSPGPHPGGEMRGLDGGVSRPTPGECVSQHALRQSPPPPQQTATATGGTHHTGMHSCFYSIAEVWPQFTIT